MRPEFDQNSSSEPLQLLINSHVLPLSFVEKRCRSHSGGGFVTSHKWEHWWSGGKAFEGTGVVGAPLPTPMQPTLLHLHPYDLSSPALPPPSPSSELPPSLGPAPEVALDDLYSTEIRPFILSPSHSSVLEVTLSTLIICNHFSR